MLKAAFAALSDDESDSELRRGEDSTVYPAGLQVTALAW